MLKSLELLGFKSFADRTRFEIPAGVTVVVGPNGSGKSNVVDAIKWVLGEQSTKSLRGKKASDVIFSGSGGVNGRRAMGAAEVTLIFDNSDGRLSIETDEVRITRRVYRGTDERSEGEYLINNQICKLSDIRELLMGTGIGTYSVIEQGRVDYLLQASPNERRLLFEEAAGISRFRKKKQEALKKLEACEQNLFRLSDIVNELQRRLNQLQSQADKAVRSREYTARLQELRLQASVMDYTDLEANRKKAVETLERLQGDLETCQTALDTAEDKIQQYENDFTAFNEEIRKITDQTAENRHAIGVSESVIQQQTKRLRELEQSTNEARQQMAEMRRRMAENRRAHRATLDEQKQAIAQHGQFVQVLGDAKIQLEEVNAAYESVRIAKEQLREQSITLMLKITTLENEITSLEQQEKKITLQIQQCVDRSASTEADLAKLQSENETLNSAHAILEARKTRCEEEKTAAAEELESRKRAWNDAKSNLANLQQRHSEMGGRVATLKGIQERHEGLSPGVCYLLTEAKRQTQSLFRDIYGLVADLIQVEVKATSVIEVALGERAQYLVVAPHSPLREALRKNPQGLPGRVGFLWMEDFLPAATRKTAAVQNVWLTNSLDRLPGVVGRADQFIQCDAMYMPLFRYMLGETWIVEDLNTAFRLREEIQAGQHALTLFPAIHEDGAAGHTVSVLPRIHFVTLGDERLDADGSLCIGPQHTSSGLILRPNELRTLTPQLTLLTDEIRRCEEEVQRTDQCRQHQETRVKQLEQELASTDLQLRESDKKVTASQERIRQMRKQQTDRLQIQTEYERQRTEAQTRRDQALLEKNAADAEATTLKTQIDTLDTELASHEKDRRERTRAVTQHEVKLAQSEERLKSLSASIHQHEVDAAERQKMVENQRAQLAEDLTRLTESQRLTLGNESQLALLYSQKERISSNLGDLQREQNAMKKERSEQTAAANRLHKKLTRITDSMGACQLDVNRYTQEQEQIQQRLAEDFHIEPELFLEKLEEMQNLTDDEREEHSEVRREITELREQIQQLGNINSEALSELNDLTERYTRMSAQYEDLNKGRISLQKLIEHVNDITRKQFLNTYEQINGYFYHIFRDLFGGGNAQLVLDNDVDPLESGVEIEVQPPGKDLRSLSLMSGGEKAMTCIALLFALFKNTPSQFCILDEVDAPLDEQNITRLTNIIQQFLDKAQFIIVSHSKKTMASANTIYGVTMQDSGVSKQVSYRFEEVNDDGILEELGVHIFPGEKAEAG